MTDILPLKDLLEVICLRVLDSESLYCLVVLRSYVMSDVLVVILGGSAVDVNYARRNLSGLRILEVG